MICGGEQCTRGRGEEASTVGSAVDDAGPHTVLTLPQHSIGDHDRLGGTSGWHCQGREPHEGGRPRATSTRPVRHTRTTMDWEWSRCSRPRYSSGYQVRRGSLRSASYARGRAGDRGSPRLTETLMRSRCSRPRCSTGSCDTPAHTRAGAIRDGRARGGALTRKDDQTGRGTGPWRWDGPDTLASCCSTGSCDRHAGCARGVSRETST